MHEDDVIAVFARAGLQDRVVPLRTKHSTRGTEEKVGFVALIEESVDDVRVAPIGADHHSCLPEWSLEPRRKFAGRVPHRLVPESLLVVAADEFSIRADQHGRVEAFFSVRFEHPGDEVNVEFAGQRSEFLEIRSVRNGFAQRPVLFERDRLVGDGVAVEEALGRADDLRAAFCSLANHFLGTLEVGFFVCADPFENDASHADGLFVRRRIFCGDTNRICN